MKTSNKIRSIIFAFSFLFLLSPITALADSGPKPSMRITVGEECVGAYATLLSEKESTGPHAAWDGTEENAYHDKNQTYGWGTPYDIWEAFVTYEDADGFYYLQSTERKISDAGEYIWGYYPPERFKLLLYFPESDSYLVSGIYERYAFHSYFSASVSACGLSLVRSYDYTAEVIGLAARIVITLTAEILLALLFFPKEGRMLLPIALINVVTQLLLNLALAKTGYMNGARAFVLRYINLELLVTAAEAAVLFFLAPLRSSCERPRMRAVLYAVVANACSFALGYAVSLLIPKLF